MSSDERLFDFQTVGRETVQLLFSAFSPKAAVTGFTPIHGGMSTSNYAVKIAGTEKRYVLRIYPANNDHSLLEAAAYAYAEKAICVPEICFFDGSKQLLPNSYLIMELIEGLPLGDFIAAKEQLPDDLVRGIGASLALLHRTQYPYMALLDDALYPVKRLESLEAQCLSLLNGIAGAHLRPPTKEKALAFLQCNPGFFREIDCEYVFSHGDFNFSNILITPAMQTYFIDFEYCFSAPRFYDAGKFFRAKSPHIQRYITSSAAAAFCEGYNLNAAKPLPREWYALSKLADLPAMLYLINKPDIPEGWGDDIDDEIVRTLALFDLL